MEQVHALSWAQQRLWFLDRLEPGSALYNLSTALRLRGTLLTDILQRSLNEIVRRHEVLRTTFHLRQGVPVQKITPVLKIVLKEDEIDLSHLPEAEREAEADRLMRAEAVRPFDLGKGPLLRVKLLRLASQDHVLLVGMHHIVSDAWSMGIMVREFSSLYEAYANSQESPLPEPAIQYSDFAEWQREWLRGETLEQQMRYWREQLTEAPVLELPADHPRPRIMSHRGGSAAFRLGTRLTQQLKELLRRENATLFMGLVAAFQIVLGRYAGQKDVAVGTAIANRNRVEIEELIGFFVNTLVLRTDLSGNPDFRQVLSRVRRVVLEAYENQDVPYEKLVEELAPQHDLSRSPLFQAAIALQNTEQAELRLPGLGVSRIDSDTEVAKFDLALVLSDGAEGVTGRLSYALDLFEADTAERLLTHLKTALQRMVAEPDLGIDEVSLLTEAEWRQVVVDWNGTARDIEKAGLHQLFEEHAKKTPRAMALEFEEEKLTYGELNRRANQLGRYLRKAGVGPEVPVGLCVERSVGMVVGLLGILKAGGAYVPLDPAFPAERLRFLLEDTQLSIAVVQERTRNVLASAITSSSFKIINLDQEQKKIGREGKSTLPVAGRPENLAYIIYTSGSTGTPKGVMVTHSGIAAMSRSQRERFEVGPGSRVLQFSTLTFDASVWEFVMGLTTGATLVLMKEDARSGQPLTDVLVREKVTHALLPPAVLETLDEKEETSLKFLLSGGDEISGELAARWSSRQRLLNAYGPTEFTVVATLSGPLSGSRKPPIGFPVLNSRLFVLDEQMNPSPVGIPGELHVTGEGLSRGYLNRPALTAEKFIPNSFSLIPGDRLYRTGDMVKWNAHGGLEFIGRRDQQVKVRGYRIEPGEIEAALKQLPEVEEAVVQARADEAAGKRLVAWVVARNGNPVRDRELRAHLRARLPEYMVPSAFVRMDSLPLTSGGKIDRRALPAPGFSGDDDAYEAPRDVQEEILCSIFADTLKLERVGIHDNFFERGGHSLLATQAMARVQSAIGVAVPLRALFEWPTVAGLSARIERERGNGDVPKIIPITRADRQLPLPLSFAQQRLWFVDQLEPGSTAYNMPLRLWLRGDLNVSALERGLNEIVRRHEVLRTRFELRDGAPVQKTEPALNIGVVGREIDLAGLPETEREAEAQRLMREEAETPFDLARGPLLRARLLRLAPSEHVLLLSMHHIVSDAWSMAIMVREFSRLYEAYARGEQSPLPEPAIQYADFAVWQREWLRGEVLERQLGYWKEQLSGVPALELPTDNPRPRVMSHRGGGARLELGRSLTRRLKALGRRENTTLFMGLLAMFQVVLARYAGQHDIAVGTAIANRNRVETEGLIGFFVNTLVLRTDLRGNPDFREVLARVRKVVLAAYENQDVPFEKLMEELAPLSPFQVGLALQNTEHAELRLPGLTVPRIDSGSDAAKFDLSLVLIEGEEGVSGRLTYALDLFEAGTAERLLSHLKTALERMVENPDLGTDDVSLLSEAERHHVMVRWNDTAREMPAKFVHELFAEQAERTPRGIALEYEGQTMTYAELNRRANQLAHYLKKLGVGPEVLTGLCLDRSLETAVGLMGILKAGGAYVPLDPAYPADRLRFMLEDARMTVVLTQEKLKPQLPHTGIVFCLDSEWARVAQEPESNPVRVADEASPAYVIYTSGSTGRPKGVVICHRGVTNIVIDAMQAFRIGPGDRLLQFVSISFDISVVDFMSVLLSGATIVLKAADVRMFGAVLDEILLQDRITTVILPPSVLQTVLPRELPLLEVLGVGGEVCPGELVRRWSANRRMINGWGPTETTVCSAFAVPLQGDKAPIGHPIANTRVYLLDERMEPVPAGLPGELYIAGVGVARGYLNRPELTAERFLPDPFTGAGERMYRTGDLGRLGPDDNLDFVARSDEQVKIRGHRIEPGEIEAALLRHAGVREAVVVAREDIPGDKRLVAYISSRWKDRSPDFGELRQLLSASLPDYMVPSAFMVVETLPLTPNGKVDRRALPVPDYSAEGRDYIAPRNAAEEILCGIFADILKVERVGIHDNFFERGGHSLMATKVVSRLRQVFDMELPLRALFEEPTPAGVALRIERERSEGRLSAFVPMRRAERDRPLPLSFAQQRLWLIDQLEPGGAAYNMPLGLWLRGDLNTAALERSLNEIVRRHEVLRTGFPLREGAPVQEIASALTIVLKDHELDLSHLPEAERETEALRLKRQESEKPFDLAHGPLLRVKLLRMGPQEHALLVNTHHIVSDAWSVGIIMREFSRLYEAFACGEGSPLPEPAIQYADYSAWQREWLQEEVLERQMDYWRSCLSDVPVLELTTDHPRPRVMSHRGGSAPFSLGRELTRQLKDLLQRENATLFMGLVAVLQVVLGRYAGQKDVAVGTAIANRNRVEIEELIGFFVNTLVLRTDLSGNPDFRQVLSRVRRVVLEAYENQDVPYEKLVEELAPQHDLSRSPLFQAAIALQNTEQAELRLPGLSVWRMDADTEPAKFDLALMLSEGAEGVTGRLSYALDLFETETAERLLTHLKTALQRMVAEPDLGIDEVSLLTEAEWRQVVVDWNGTARDIEKAGLHQLFEEHAKKTPKAIALEFEEEKLTYAELNRRANQLGRYLRKAGAGPEVPVGLCVERSVGIVVGLLGILKAGGAYVPLDPAYPAERLRFLLEDTQIPIAVVQERTRNVLASAITSSLKIINLDQEQKKIGHEGKSNLPAAGGPGNLAYIIYTSGSTGTPKGVMVTHSGIAAMSRSQRERFDVGPGSRVLQFSALTFDASVWEFVMGLTTGATLVLMKEDARSGQPLTDVLVREKVTHALFPPVVLETLDEKHETHLKVLMTAGDELSGELVARWSPRYRMFNAYGPTEFTVDATISAPLSGSRKPSIGSPALNSRLYVLDDRMNLSPVGVPGELHVAGDGLGRGYLNRPDLTAERFIPNPFGRAGERFYRTGDVVRWKADGNLEFLGRCDQQVKVRGYRIEPGEIETVLKQLPEVEEAVVQVRADEAAGKRLVAWIVARDGSPFRERALRAHLQSRLPEYMVPSAFVKIDAVPLTSGGKIDRRALPAPGYTAADYEPPRDAEEEILCGIFADILKLERVGIHDNFFERGGHSLLATQAVSRIRKVSAAELSLRAMFESPTVAGLAARLRAARGDSLPAPLARADRSGELPLSWAQQRLWFISQLEPESAAYNIPIGLRLSGDLDRAALQASLSEIVRRHEVLRTTFPGGNGRPMQRISPELSLKIEVTDLRNHAPSEREAEAWRLARVEAGRPFDLGRGPLLRVRLLQLAERDHVLLVTMHHIVSDAWSMSIMVREFRRLYQAHIENQDAGLPELPIQYADFAAWQRQWLQGEVLEEQLVYWRKQLADAPTLELPTDHPRPKTMTHRGENVPLQLSEDLTGKLRELGNRYGVTMFMTLLAGLQTMLGRYSGQRDVSVGTAFANRNREEIEGLIGFFISTLVLRADLSGNPDFAEVLRRGRDVALEAYRHQDVPFERLVEELAPRRDTSRSALFQVSLVLQNQEREELQLSGLRLTAYTPPAEMTKFDLSFMLSDRGAKVGGALCYACDLFERTTMERLVGHFRLVLEQMVADPERRIEDVSLVTEAERRQLLVEWNRTEVAYPPACVHELFEGHAERTPELTAVVGEDGELSYAELNRRSNQLAHYLKKLGVRPESRVGLCLSRGVGMVVGLMGILKAGGAYLPLDPKLPKERLAFMLSDSGAVALLTEESLSAGLPSGAVQVVLIDGDQDRFAHEPVQNVSVRVSPENLLYLIYTSGSTGRPKAVGIEHRQVVNYQRAVSERARFGPGAGFALVSSLAADLGNTMVFPALCGGGTLHVISEETALNARMLRDYLDRHRVDHIKITPTHLRALLNGENSVDALPTGQLVLGGEASSWDWVAGLRSLRPQLRILNHYGPTECTVGATTWEFDGKGGKPSSATLPLGRPLNNVHVYVLDSSAEPVPIGIAGELCIGGAGVGRGYLDRPDLTAERFLPDAFASAKGARLYRTGDRVKWLADGNLEFLGRLDEQIKVRGFRIEPGEIEAALLEHPAVAQAVVATKQDVNGDNRLVAWLVSSGTIAISELRDALKRRLPEYMVPAAFVTLDALPLMPNGKIDRRKLPEPPESESSDGVENEFDTPIGEMLAGIWSQVLRVERVGIADNFFELGGHSLLATQVIARVRSGLGVELPLRALFEEPTVAGLARRIELERQKGSSPNAAPMRRADREGPLPLSFAQQRLWFIDQLEPGSGAYNIPFGLRLTGDLNREALEWSIREIVRRHEVLRTIFVTQDGVPVQKIAEEAAPGWEEVDLRGWPEEKREAEARRMARVEASSPFDLSRGPLLRVKLLRLREKENVLLACMHHIASDGWSVGITVRELTRLYAGYVNGEKSALPELRMQYADFALWQREWLRGEVLERQLTYWKNQIEGAPLLNLPADRPRPRVESHRGGNVQFELDESLTGRLKQLSRREGATLFMTLLTAFTAVLSRYTGQTDISIGTDVANRNRVETEGLIGFFVNELVLRTDTGGQPSFRELLGRIRQTTLQAYEHQDLPFERLVEELAGVRDLGRAPLFQVSLVMQNVRAEMLHLSGVEVSSLSADDTPAKIDLEMIVSERPAGLRGVITYAVDLFDRSTMERLVNHLRRMLESAVADPERAVTEINLLSQEERLEVLEIPNQSDREIPEKCAHQLFEDQAARVPASPAVEGPEGRFTYEELNRHANQIAHYLRDIGVDREERVGVYMDRTSEMPAVLLGILKAGAAYVPLDPAYPAERLAWMVRDSNMRVVVTRERFVSELPGSPEQVISLDRERESIASRPAGNPAWPVYPESLAYVIYTSGSTGRPKGAMIEQRGMLNHLCAKIADLGLNSADVVAQNAPSSFDISVWQILAALLVGGRIRMMDDETSRDAWKTVRETREHGVTILETVPTMLAAMMAEHERTDEGFPPKSLRWMVSNAEALPSGLCETWLQRYSGTALMNTYGATESSDDNSHYHIRESLPEGLSYAPLGFPIINATLYVLDSSGQPAPVGVPGEICIGGFCPGRGYLNQPGLTAAKFVPDPFTRREGARLYRTGDRARRRADGLLEFLGRDDGQVKIRGHRVELGEIETAFTQYPEVEHAVVLVKADKSGENYLAGYVVPVNKSIPLDIAALRGHLQQCLPEHMVPRALVELPVFPLTPSGKLDRRALPEPEQVRGDLSFAAPRDGDEEILCGIFAEVLGVASVGIQDDFFELGGHSLLATQVVSRVRKIFGIELPLRDLFEATVVSRLAERVREYRGSARGSMPPLRPVSRAGDLPLSYAQQRLWFVDQLEPGSGAWNVPMAVRLRGDLSVDALKRALNEIVRRHEVLRTAFPMKNGQPVQNISPEFTLIVRESDLSGLSGAEQEMEARRSIQAEASAPFDLAHGPLVRAKLVRMGADDHVVLVTMHHIVSDGWSTGIMMAELARLYEAYMKGEESPLPKLAIQYADFAVWQREWLRGKTLEEQTGYWTEQLRDAPVLALPTDRPRPAVPTRKAARLMIETSPELKSALTVISRRAGTTLYMTLLSAFQTLLARYSGQTDVVVGIPIAGRGYAETESLIGLFFNVLAVRMNLSGDPGFRELLGRARETMLGAYAHQDLPFERLVSELDLERDLRYSPLFQVIFEMDNTPRGQGAGLPGLAIEGVGNEHEVAKVDLTLTMADQGSSVRGSLQYSVDLFDRATIGRMIGHYRTLLEGIAEDPDRRLSDLPMMSAAERDQVVAGWNATEVGYPGTACMHELFERQADKTPDLTAVVHAGHEMSYRELDEQSSRLANYLRKLNVGPETRVGICVGRGPEMVTGLLGILKAGGAYVPLDPTYPADRLGYMIGDSQATVVLTNESLLERIPQSAARVVCLDRESREIAEESVERPASGVTAENLAYIYYTSGSTGQPKGVAMAHSGIANYIRWGVEAYEAAGGNGAAVHSSIAVDLTLTNLLPLFTGQKMALADDTPGVEGLVELIQARPEWSLLKLTPTHLALLNARLSVEEMKHSTRVLVIGADNLVAEPTLVWREQAPEVKLLNEYGPTETVVGCSIYRIGEDAPRHGAMPIGKPIANMTMYVLDGYGHPLPVGVPGELYIGGIGVARGYWGRPDLTAEKFVPDPFAGREGARFYRTGDRARFLADGNLEFLGRIDHQVKIRGYRIEPAEVEAVLSGCPGVQKAMVVVREDAPGEKRLVGYVAAPGGEVEAGDLRQFLRDRLPEYMVPAAWVILEALPVRASGKIDPKDLPRPEMEGDAEKYVAPATEVERKLAAIWEAVLGVKQVGIHDNFFELGGDSILSIQIITRAREAGLRFQPRQMFERQTIAELAEVAGSEAEPVEAEQGAVRGEVEMTPMQKAFFEWGLAKPDHYNQSVLLEVKSDVDTRLLEESVVALLVRHDALRMRYEPGEDGQWRQWCEAAVQESVYERRDLSEIQDESEQRAELERDGVKAQAGLDLKSGRLMKVVEYDLGGERGRRLLMVIHHLVVDGVSWRILLEDLERGYRQRQRGETPALGAKTTSFRQWAEKLRQYGEEESVRQEAEYWGGEGRKRAGRIPRDYEDGENLFGTQNGVAVWLEEEETKRLLQDVPGVYQTQINDVLLTALGRVCGEWSGSGAVLVDVEGHGREDIFANVDISRTTGWFTTVYPVLLECGGEGWEPGEALTGTKERLREIPNRGIGYGVLRYGGSGGEVRRRLEEMPQAEISFNYLGQIDQMVRESMLFRPAREQIGGESAPGNVRQHPLAVSGMVVRGRLQMNWRYSDKLHRRETIEALAGRYIDCLRDLMAHCLSADAGGFTPSDFDLAKMTPEALRQVAAQLDD